MQQDIAILAPFNVRELLAVYQALEVADQKNGTSFAQEQKEYIERYYPDIIIEGGE